jgi:hypothetical protein
MRIATTIGLFLALLLRVIAVLLVAWAADSTYFAMCARLESSAELQQIRELDLLFGAAWGISIVLFFFPDCIKKPVRCLLVLGIAAMVWFCVSGFLISSHEWQHYVRSHL